MSGFEKILLHASTWFSAATGLIYLYMKYVMTTDDPFSAIHHPWQPLFLALHILVVPVLILALGVIAREHVLGRFLEGRRRGGWASGVATTLLAAPMIVSGYLMQVLTGPAVRRTLVVTHVASGVVFALLFLGHLVVARPGRRVANGSRPDTARGGARLRRRLDWRTLRGILAAPRGRPAARQGGAEARRR